MSITGVGIKLLGFALAVVGFALLLSAVGVELFGIHVNSILLAIILGVGLLGLGIFIVRGGTPTV